MLVISIKKLFGRFDYKVKLNNEGLTIITGPNGYGKSTILKCIDALSRELDGLIFFNKLDFESLVVEFDNNIIEIQKNDTELLINNISVNTQFFMKGIQHRSYIDRLD
ncbi:MAG TPA: hypothetical protein DDZ33_07505, partial [Clostridium sp.]|nr:hypothetical protein [Clostridium sp.]